MRIKRPSKAKSDDNPHQETLDLIPVTDACNLDSQRDLSGQHAAPGGNTSSWRISALRLKKIDFLLDLYGCRLDVYAEFWQYENRKGYKTKCLNHKVPGICNKLLDWKFDCKTCGHRDLASLTVEVINRHLTRPPHIGIYPLMRDHTCRFVVIDLDSKKEGLTKAELIAEVREISSSCIRYGIPHAVEISRSGAGFHVWIFFTEFVPAILARKLALGIQNDAAQRLGLLKLVCYDRILPNQDFLPNGGTGTVIALPFQFLAVQNRCSVYVDPDNDFKPIKHQLQLTHLKNLPRLSPADLKQKIGEIVLEGEHELGVPYMLDGDPNSFWRKTDHQPGQIADLPDSVSIELGAGLSFDTSKMPKQLTAKIARLAAFPNPVFFMRQKQGRSTGGVPIVESQILVDGNVLKIPRGCLDATLDLLKHHNVTPVIIDRRSFGKPIDIKFIGTLRDDQAEALGAMLQHDFGTLKAAPSFGKTVMGAALIARRQVSTLIVVHRKHLARQWRSRLTRFLEISPDQIGVLGGPRSKPSGIVDIVMMGTLAKMTDVEQMTDAYGQVIIDECHRSAAKSITGKLNEIRAAYVEGLSATPKRSDGRQPLVFMTCGNVRYVSRRPEGSPQDLMVKPIQLSHSIQLPEIATTNDLYAHLMADADRTSLIADEALRAYARGRHVIVLTGRKAHLNDLAVRFKGEVANLFIISSDLTAKQRDQVMADVEALPENIPRLVVSTWQLIGEGFDHAPLNTLVQCLPYSWEGTATQCAGRLDRYLPGKLDAEIIDIVDKGHPTCVRMWKARSRAYRKIGYRVMDEGGSMDLF